MKTILSIDGGGMRGYIPAHILAELETLAQKPCCEIFDLIAGTSVGGILACLAALGKPMEQGKAFFKEDGPNIFGHKNTLNPEGLFGPRYNSTNITSALQNRMGPMAGFADCKTKLLVSSFDLTTYSPYFFKSYGTDNYYLWQAARASSSAQSYFPPYEANGHVWWDGGNVVNNPAIPALADARRLWGNDEEVLCMSLGCGASRSPISLRDLGNVATWGVVRVGIVTMSVLFDSGPEEVDYEMQSFLGSNYFRIQPCSQDGVAIDGCTDQDLQSLETSASKCWIDNLSVIQSFLNLVNK